MKSVISPETACGRKKGVVPQDNAFLIHPFNLQTAVGTTPCTRESTRKRWAQADEHS